MSTQIARVLVVDDERDLAESCAYFLKRAGYGADTAYSGEEALELLAKNQYAMVITDLKMPRMTGLSLLKAIKANDPDVEVVMITGFPEVETAVEAMKNGALDYITKPFEEEALLERVEKAMAHLRLKEQNEALKERLRHGAPGRQLIYKSELFGKTVELLERAARTDASVLIQGESGTGKELLAHYLHDCSSRASRPFVPVDCTTLPENLVESELFGHVKGSFSGANENKMGLFQVAAGGTLFLDEVGELALSFQTKLLRAIQERKIRKVGGNKQIDIDVRIVCATNRNLARRVDEGEFRQDLFYRLDVVRIDVPTLRDRLEDVEPMVRHFLQDFLGRNPSCEVRDFSQEAMLAMKAFAWPGNVRQLRNAVQRACTLGSTEEILLADLPDELSGAALGTDLEESASGETFQAMKARQMAAIETTYLESLLRKYQGNVTRSADEAGMARSAFQRLMQRYNIKSVEFRDEE
ncbi:MAG: sigma-54-dependent transcriptional regulator [Planctomycetota bacterium]